MGWACPALPAFSRGPGFESEGVVPPDPVQAAPLSPLRKPPRAYQGGPALPVLSLGRSWDGPSASGVQPEPCHCVPTATRVMWGPRYGLRAERGPRTQPSSSTRWLGRGGLRDPLRAGSRGSVAHGGGLGPAREGPVTQGAAAGWEVGPAARGSSGPSLEGLGPRAPIRTPPRGPCGAQSAARRWAGRCPAGRAQGWWGRRAAPEPRRRWGGGSPGGRRGAGTAAAEACP